MSDPRNIPDRLRGVYGLLAPDPDAEYGSLLPFARDKKTGDKRLAMPSVLREGLLGITDLLAGTETGNLTPRAMETITFGSLGGGAALAPRGAVAMGGAKPIRAYHGSPHDFDKFSMSKIGTGEGAQAYGHGLYFAGNERVAQVYRDALGGDAFYIGGKQVTPKPGSGEEMALAWMRSAPSDVDPYAWARRHMVAERNAPHSSRYSQERLNEAEAALTALFDAGAKPGAGGKMYEVNLHADPNRFLDWDKPLSGQSAPVRDALSKAPLSNLDESGGQIYRNYLPDIRYSVRQGDTFAASNAKTFQEALDAAGGNPANIKRIHNYSQPAASQQLSDLGIPGIKYLDGGSRSSGTGSSNYVAFDDSIIEILRKYGLMSPAPVATPGFNVQPEDERPRGLLGPL